MKYQVGDQVKYDSGDWWFYGTVSAIIENSISPCYRLNVERMEKKNCKFSITQFEFELEADQNVESDKEKRKWEDSENDYLKKYHEVLNQEDLSKVIEPEAEPEITETPQTPDEVAPKRKRGEAWDMNLEAYRKGEKSNAIFTWASQNRREYKSGKMKEDRYAKLLEINFPFEAKKEPIQEELPPTTEEPPKQNKLKTWDMNLEAYRKGEKSNAIFAWVSHNRKEYRTGNMKDDKYAKLLEINFPFEKGPRLKQEKLPQTEEESLKGNRGKAWELNFEAYRKGEKSNAIFTWVSQNRREYKSGKLKEDKYTKLLEINFPFEKQKSKQEKLSQTKDESQKRSKGDTWEINYEAYRKGEKSNTISTWIASNRREYKSGKLSDEKFEKLMTANFPFDVVKKKDSSWDYRLEEWKKGERRSKLVQQWRQRSVNQYLEGKLSGDKIVKLKEIGILK